MYILTLENTAYEMNEIPDEVDDLRFAILDNSDTVRAAFPTVMDDRYFTLRYEDNPAYSTNAWPFTGPKDPGYHGDPRSQEYLADVYFKLITETCKIQ